MTKIDWKDHVNKLELTLNKVKGGIIKCNTENYLFGKTEMEYLGFWVTNDGVRPLDKKRRNREYDTTDYPEGGS